MPILSELPIRGRVVYLGVVHDRDITLCSDPVERVEVDLTGFKHDWHGGIMRPSCGRVRNQYPRGTRIRNTRQATILSVEELAATAAAMDIPAIRPEWVGANLVLEGVPELTTLSPNTRLMFEGGVCLTVDLENGPCNFVSEVIEEHHPGKGMRFVKCALGRRGLSAWVEKPGEIALGEEVRLFLPPQRLYAPALALALAAE